MKEIAPLRKPYQFLNGTLAEKSYTERLQMGQSWEQLLKDLGGEHTFHPPAETLAFAMGTGHAIAAQTIEGSQAGYVKMTPWTMNGDGKVGMGNTAEDFAMMEQGKAKPVCVEIGSLVVAETEQKNNLAKHLVAKIVDTANISYPGLPKIAVVTNDNTNSLKVFTKLEWPVASPEEALAYLGIDVLDDWPHPSTIFIYNGPLE